MTTYILRRLLLMVPTLIGMTLVLFLMVRFAPGLLSGGGEFGGGGEMRNVQARAAQQELIKRRLHMIDPKTGKEIALPMQYVYWLWDTVRGDFGESIQYNTKVSSLIAERLPVTLTLNLFSTALVYGIAIPGGMLAAIRRGRLLDVGWSMGTLALFSLPVIWIGSMMVGFLCNPQYLNLFPAVGMHSSDTQMFTSFEYATDYLWHLVLPVLCLSYGQLAVLSKLQRGAMLDNMAQDYVRTARAKGLSEVVVLTRHVFRNSLLPMITVFAGIIPSLLGGAVITETIFSIKGMGELAVAAVLSRDVPIIQAIAFIGSVISLLCLLIRDVCYAIADPRVSYE